MELNVYLETLGCSKNQIDSEIMLGILREQGFNFTNVDNEADVIVVNTCGFIDKAKEESINTILELAENKKYGKCKILIVTGCLSERYSDVLSKEIPEIDAFLGTTTFEKIAEVIRKKLNEKDKLILTGNINKKVNYNRERFLTTPSYSSYIKIAEGCDSYCTYCIIPKLRGKYYSRKKEDIITEAISLANKGVKELILIAQDTSRYGLDLYNKLELPNLLKSLSSVEGIEWIRLQYLYPDYLNDELIDVIKNNEKICNYVDIPIQHCNDEILKKMNRKITKIEIIELIEKLRNRIPDIAIRTTLMVGFPGETQEQFEELYQFVKDMEFDKLGVFTYSREEGTPAANFKGQIPNKIKKHRLNQIMELQKNISYQKNKKKIGKIYDILIEEKISDENIYIGRTKYDSPEVDGIVYLKSDKLEIPIGSIVKGKITDALEYDLIGEILNVFSE